MSNQVKFVKFSCDSDKYLEYLNSENREVLHEEAKNSFVLTHIHENGSYHWAFNYCDNNGYLNELSYNGNLTIQSAVNDLAEIYNQINSDATEQGVSITQLKDWINAYTDLQEKIDNYTWAYNWAQNNTNTIEQIITELSESSALDINIDERLEPFLNAYNDTLQQDIDDFHYTYNWFKNGGENLSSTIQTDVQSDINNLQETLTSYGDFIDSYSNLQETLTSYGDFIDSYSNLQETLTSHNTFVESYTNWIGDRKISNVEKNSLGAYIEDIALGVFTSRIQGNTENNNLLLNIQENTEWRASYNCLMSYYDYKDITEENTSYVGLMEKLAEYERKFAYIEYYLGQLDFDYNYFITDALEDPEINGEIPNFPGNIEHGNNGRP